MHRNHLFLIAAFVAGMLVGVLAAGDYKSGVEPG